MLNRKIAVPFFIVFWLIGACQSSEGMLPQNTPLLGRTPSYPTATEFNSSPASSLFSPTQVQLTSSLLSKQESKQPSAPTKTRALINSPTPAHLLTPQPSPIPTLDPENWMEWPVVPLLSERVKEIYQAGIALGNQPNAFSKVGDCGSTPSWFLGDFDRGPRFYNLGDYSYLQTVINYYQGSFGRTSLAALAGYNTSSVLTPLWSNKEFCANDESPLACEYRLHRPIIALITLGANDVYHIESFEPQLRKIVEYSIQQGVIPVLATKPDNVEQDHRINQITAHLAAEYQIPLWNYWKAVQPLPNHGLQEDGVHITFAGNDFSNPLNLQAGWPVRNLTALQVLYALYTYLNNTP
jgi:hypothetical protein